MRGSLPLIALLLVAAPLSAAQKTNGKPKGKTSGKTTVEQTLKQVENEWAEAFTKKDSAALEKILADDWMGQYVYGPRTKAQVMDDLKSENLKFELSQPTGGMKVRVFGNTAVVT